MIFPLKPPFIRDFPWILMGYPLVNVYIHNYGTSPSLMGKSTMSMVIFNSKLLNYQRVYIYILGQSTGWVETNPAMSFGINGIIYIHQLRIYFIAGYLRLAMCIYTHTYIYIYI